MLPAVSRFRTGRLRRLPHLTSLGISGDGRTVAAPEGTRLVSCCPALRSVDVRLLTNSAELLGPLRGLSGL
mgnify:CR=1 FL=1